MSFLAATLDELIVRYLELCSQSENRKRDVPVIVAPGEIVVDADEMRALVKLVEDASLVAALCYDSHEAMGNLRVNLAKFAARLKAKDFGVRLQR